VVRGFYILMVEPPGWAASIAPCNPATAIPALAWKQLLHRNIASPLLMAELENWYLDPRRDRSREHPPSGKVTGSLINSEGRLRHEQLNVSTGLSSEFVRRINAGETFDVIAAPPAALDGLINSRKVVADSKTNLAPSAAVRAGAPKPDISSVEAVKCALLNAKSITYLPGLPQLIERLGLRDAIASKVTTPDTDISSEFVAKGEIELGIVAITQTFTAPGVELVGPLPPEIQFYTNFGGAVSATSKAPDASRDLLKFLKGPTSLRVIKAQGMEPI
jgi:molybdate transport system substrate-binding protein